MGLFNNSFSSANTKPDASLGQAMMHGRFGAAMLFSAVVHISLLGMQIVPSHTVDASVLMKKTIALNVRIGDAADVVNNTEHAPQKETLLHGAGKTKHEVLERFVATEPLSEIVHNAHAEVVTSGTEEVVEPIKGMMIGAVGFSGWGGARKRPFQLVGAAEHHIQNAVGETDRTGMRIEIAQAVVAEMKDELNRTVPADAGQICRLQASVACQKRNESLEKYLLLKAPMLQQLVGGRLVSVASHEGLWKVEISN